MNDSIFSRADYERLKAAQRDVEQILPMLDKAERCGVNCEVARGIQEEIRNRLDAIERHYFNDLTQLRE